MTISFGHSPLQITHQVYVIHLPRATQKQAAQVLFEKKKNTQPRSLKVQFKRRCPNITWRFTLGFPIEPD